MSGIFTGLVEHYNSGNKDTKATSTPRQLMVGHVMRALKHGDPLLQKYPISEGSIIVKLVGYENDKEDTSITHVAFPIDRTNYRLPFAGEEVLVIRYQSDIPGTFVFYYTAVITAEQYLGNNINPFLSGGPYKVSTLPKGTIARTSEIQKLTLVDPKIEQSRFENINDFTTETLHNTKVMPTLPKEGETILEGRMGGVIKLTHTNSKPGVWNENQITNIGVSEDGSPMLLLKASRRTNSVTEGFKYEDFDINADASNMYLLSNQNVPLIVESSNKMTTWGYTMNNGTVTAQDDLSTSLRSFFKDSYDPTFVPEVITSGIVVQTGGGGNGAAQGLDAENALAYDLILKYEGMAAEAGWDISNWRIGHGSSTITLSNGIVTRLNDDKTQRPIAIDPTTGVLTYVPIGDTVTKDGQKFGSGIIWHSNMTTGAQEYPLITVVDADRDLARRVKTEFVPDVIEYIGRDVADFIGIGGVAALASIKYNYGNISKQGAGDAAKNAYVQNDINILVNHIKGLTAGPKRRAFEANVVLTKTM